MTDNKELQDSKKLLQDNISFGIFVEIWGFSKAQTFFNEYCEKGFDCFLQELYTDDNEKFLDYILPQKMYFRSVHESTENEEYYKVLLFFEKSNKYLGEYNRGDKVWDVILGSEESPKIMNKDCYSFTASRLLFYIITKNMFY